ncbi:hypothetical protein SPI_07222 [Niveomyces insectorum RCEF 264]|uniref:Peroxin 22-like protein n=1 Tax=Niveomyces insectorum RCEF 264 TaxID=1081102 RepID=A0A167QED1_9HYPO|nr:hypothetical protein SPI_07222 [Niveomyces insectorum RCEF 264]
MSAPYDGGSSSRRRRGVFSHWVPLVLTLTIATAGVAAWAWSQRSRDDDEYENEDGHGGRPSHAQSQQYTEIDYENADYGENPPYGASNARSDRAGPATASGSTVGNNTIRMTDASPGSGIGGSGGGVGGSAGGSGWGARMSGALGGGASSPQQWVGQASKAVTAGITAASAAVGGALASIREGDKDAYADHETWSEEADARRDRPAASAAPAAAAPSSSSARDAFSRKRKTVAIVVSADNHSDGGDDDGFLEHASILSYIPRQNDFTKTRIFVLIYAPGLKDAASADALSPSVPQPTSLSSSFSNIGPETSQTSQPSPLRPDAPASASGSGVPAGYSAVYAQARALVEKEAEIIPFTSPNGHAHILHLLEPDVVYLQESLTGDNGAVVNQLQNWMRNDVVVVVGAESGTGGLADSESEAEKPVSGGAAAEKHQIWWQREDRVGRGRGVVVVDGLRVNDDWHRRVQGRD